MTANDRISIPCSEYVNMHVYNFGKVSIAPIQISDWAGLHFDSALAVQAYIVFPLNFKLKAGSCLGQCGNTSILVSNTLARVQSGVPIAMASMTCKWQTSNDKCFLNPYSYKLSIHASLWMWLFFDHKQMKSIQIPMGLILDWFPPVLLAVPYNPDFEPIPMSLSFVINVLHPISQNPLQYLACCDNANSHPCWSPHTAWVCFVLTDVTMGAHKRH